MKVTISGSNDTAIIEETPVNIDIVIPGVQGPAGPAGAEGPEGPEGPPGASGASTWGSITGTLSDQTDLQSALNAKVTANAGITASTKTKITYDSKGLVTAGADLALGDLPTVGLNTQVIFNDGGVLGADSDLVYNKTTNVLTSGAFQVGTAYPIKTLSNNNEIVIGKDAAASITGATNNTIAIGTNAGNGADGLSNATAIGPNSGSGSTGCTNSLMVGSSAGEYSTGLTFATLVGYGAGNNATYDGLGPEIFGAIFIGQAAGGLSTNSYETIAIGNGTCGNHSGYRVLGIGPSAFATSGVTNSIGIGQYSFEQCGAGDNNLGFGDYTFNYATNPQSCVAVGVNAGSYSVNALSSVFIGANSGQYANDSSYNIGVGPYAISSSTSAYACTAMGSGVLGNSVNPYYVIAIGEGAVVFSNEVRESIAIGNSALANNFAFDSQNVGNISIGDFSMEASDSASLCIGIGKQALRYIINSNRLIAFGENAGQSLNAITDSIMVGNGATVAASQALNIGNILFGTGIKNDSTPDATPFSGGKLGVMTNAPTATLDVEGDVKLGVGGNIFLNCVSATATLDFPSVSSNSYEDLTMTVTGATVGASVFLGAPDTFESNLTFCGWVTAVDTVTIRIHNGSGGAIDPASNTWRATVFNY